MKDKHITPEPVPSSTIDQKDIERFNALADEWWNPVGSMKALHLFTPIRIEYILRSIRRAGLIASSADAEMPLADKLILDIGCGGGLLAEPMAKLGADITAIDASENAINAAKAHAIDNQLNINYQNTSIEQMADLPINQQKFDIIYASEVIEHIMNRETFIAAIAQMLKADGLVVITTINKTISSLLFAKIGAEYLLKLIPVGTHQFNQFITPQELHDEFAKQDIFLDDITGFMPNISGGFSFSSLTAINYGASGQFMPK